MPKTVLITGGGRGLGRGVARRLAEQGHRVVLTARDPKAGARVVEEIRRASPGADVQALPLELASLEAVRGFGEVLPAGLRIDTLFHVAGIMQQSPQRRVTPDGFEETLAVNVLAPFVLTHALLPRLGTGTGPARVVTVSSRLHLPGSRGVPVDFSFEDPNLARGYHPERAYKNSKLAVLWFAQELARRADPSRLTSHAVCPGFVPETIVASTHGMMRLMMRFVLPHMPFATRLEDAVDALSFTATDAALDRSTGLFWTEKQPSTPSPQALDPEQARRFWTWAEAVTRTGNWSFPS